MAYRQLKNIYKIFPSDEDVVIYTDANVEYKQTYKTFIKISEELILAVEDIINSSEVNITSYSPFLVALDITPNLFLPVLIYSLIQTSTIFFPIDVNKPLSQLFKSFRKVKLKLLIIHKNNLETFLDKVENEDSITIEIIKEKFAHAYVVVFLHYTNHLPSLETTSNCIPLLETTSSHAYIIETSGSTGESKLVVVPHQCIIPNIEDLRLFFTLKSTDVIFISSALTFDASLLLMFLTWSSQACMVLTTKEILCQPNHLINTLHKFAVTILQCTPSLLLLIGTSNLKKYLFHDKTSLRVLALGGETFISQQMSLILQLHKSTVKLFNIYGVTELSAWASIQAVEPTDILSRLPLVHNEQLHCADWVSIGNALSNTTIHLRYFDEQKEYGEIMLGTTERKCYIVENEAQNISSIHTGDVGKIINNKMHYCGRINNLIKRNAHFISLDKLEITLLKMESISQCCVIYHESNFTIFILPNKSIQANGHFSIKANIISYIKDHLSKAYIPTSIKLIDSFPLTSHGKVDKSKLSKSLITKSKVEIEIKNKDDIKLEIKKIVQEAWSMSLSQTDDSCDNDYFTQCGGDSFSAALFTNEIMSNIHSPTLVVYEVLFHKILTENYKEILNYISTCNDHFGTNISNKQENVCVINSSSLSSLCKPMHFTVKCYTRQPKFNRFMLGKHSLRNQTLQLKERWRVDLKKCVDASPLVVINKHGEGVVYIGSHSHLFCAISLATGKIIWERLLPGRIESTAIVTCDGEFVCFGCYDGCLYVLHAENGHTYWTYRTNNSIKSSPTSVGYVQPQSSIVIVGSHDHYLHAVNVTTKQCLWKLYGGGSCFSSPLVDNNYSIYGAFLNGKILSIELNTGKVLWENNLCKPIFSSPCCLKSLLMYGCVDGYLYAFHNKDGELKWKYKTKGPIFSSPLCFGIDSKEYIICSSNDGCMYCLNINGGCQWVFTGEAPFYSTPTVYLHPRNKLFVIAISTNGSLYVVDVETGICEMKYSLKGEVFSSPVVVGNDIVIGCRDNNVYSLKFDE